MYFALEKSKLPNLVIELNLLNIQHDIDLKNPVNCQICIIDSNQKRNIYRLKDDGQSYGIVGEPTGGIPSTGYENLISNPSPESGEILSGILKRL